MPAGGSWVMVRYMERNKSDNNCWEIAPISPIQIRGRKRPGRLPVGVAVQLEDLAPGAPRTSNVSSPLSPAQAHPLGMSSSLNLLKPRGKKGGRVMTLGFASSLRTAWPCLYMICPKNVSKASKILHFLLGSPSILRRGKSCPPKVFDHIPSLSVYHNGFDLLIRGARVPSTGIKLGISLHPRERRGWCLLGSDTQGASFAVPCDGPNCCFASFRFEPINRRCLARVFVIPWKQIVVMMSKGDLMYSNADGFCWSTNGNKKRSG